MSDAQRQTDALVAKLQLAASTGSMVTITSIEARVLVRVLDEWRRLSSAKTKGKRHGK